MALGWMVGTMIEAYSDGIGLPRSFMTEKLEPRREREAEAPRVTTTLG